jgi:predicted protein tyrosine phosphatase
MTLIVCGLSHLPGVIARRRPSHMISLLDPPADVETPAGFDGRRHLRIGVSDIDRPAEGYVLADDAMVAELIDFGRDWDDQAPLVIHCLAGISRSTAGAFAIACERNPDVPELEIARILRRAAPHAHPNRRIVALADNRLGRRGRMVRAVEAIGGNNFASMGAPFDLPVRY